MYKNLGELMTTINMTRGQCSQLQASIEQWFAKHPEHSVTGLRSNDEVSKIEPLLESLSNEYRVWFD